MQQWRKNDDHATTVGNSMSEKEIEDHSSSANEGDIDIFPWKHDVRRRSRRIITTPQVQKLIFDQKIKASQCVAVAHTQLQHSKCISSEQTVD